MKALKFAAWTVIGVRWVVLTALLVVMAGKAGYLPIHIATLKSVWLVWVLVAIVVLEVIERLIASVLEAHQVYTDPIPWLCQLPPPFGWIASIATMGTRLWGWHKQRKALTSGLSKKSEGSNES